MDDYDRSLAYDFDWALFPHEEPGGSRARRWGRRLEVAFIVVLTWFVAQPLSIVLACAAVGSGEFLEGRRRAKSIPDRAASRICLLFTYAWGTWTLGVAGIAAFFVIAALNVSLMGYEEFPAGAATALLLAPCGFLVAMLLTAAGLVQALRSGLRIWIGEGMNQVRTLLLGQLIILFMVFAIFPILVLLVGDFPRNGDPGTVVKSSWGVLMVALFAGPVAILIILDRIGRRIIASHPGKFGPKVPSVGKWKG
jgi:hypothetical protein